MVSVFGRMITNAGVLVRTSRKLESNPDPERSGGYLTWGVCNHSARFSARVGTLTDITKWDKYMALSQEKALRVMADYQRGPDLAISSWQSRDATMERYGGAVLFNLHGGSGENAVDIIAFSGLDEHVDEAVSLALGRDFGLVDEEFVKRVLEISGNPVYKDLTRTASSAPSGIQFGPGNRKG